MRKRSDKDEEFKSMRDILSGFDWDPVKRLLRVVVYVHTREGRVTGREEET